MAITTGAGIEEAAARALGTMRQVMPARLRHRIDTLAVTPLGRGGPDPQSDPQADTDVLLVIGAAIRAREVLRFDYTDPSETETETGTGTGGGAGAGTGPPGPRPPRRVEPLHLLTRGGRWYLLALDLDRDDWRTFRVDRITPRTPNGPRFTPREISGGDAATFVAARFRGSPPSATGTVTWPCEGEVVLRLPATEVTPYLGDGAVEALGLQRCRVRMGAWSWAGLAASIGRLDADIDAVDPPELRAAFAALADRFTAAAAAPPTAPL